MINNAKVVFMFSISVCCSDSALGLKISLDCMGECMVVDIYEDAFNAIVVVVVNYHLVGFVIKSCFQDN